MVVSSVWLGLTSILLTAWLVLGSAAVYANRFGPPWESRVMVDRANLYTQPDVTSSPVGPLTRNQIVVVINEAAGADGTAWTQTPDGWIASSQIEEETQPWIAEVSVASVSI